MCVCVCKRECVFVCVRMCVLASIRVNLTEQVDLAYNNPPIFVE